MKKLGLVLVLGLLIVGSIAAYAGNGGIYTCFRATSTCVAELSYTLTYYNLKPNEKAVIEILGTAEGRTRGKGTWQPQVWISDMGKITNDTCWKLEVKNSRKGSKKKTYSGTVGTCQTVTCRPKHFM